MTKKYDPICDIFSLGLIFYLLLIGKSAFSGKTYNEVLSQNRAGTVNLAIDEFKNVSAEAKDLLEKMLMKKPEQRISAAEALKHPYFKLESADSESEDEQLDISKKSAYSTECDSPLLTSANPKRKLNKSLKKDSCVDFKMAKDNMMTGKTEGI